MPSLIDTAEFVAGLAAPDISVDITWCTHVRHRRSTCSACMDACPSGAISLDGIFVGIDKDICTGCGSCVSSCPTQAIVFEKPSYAALLSHMESLAEQGTSKRLAICCSQVLGNHDANDPQVLAIPCLALIDPSLLVHAATLGLEVLMADGGCSTCLNAHATNTIKHTKAEVTHLLASWNAPGTIRWRSVSSDDIEGAGVDRRGIFSRLVTDAKDSALKAATESLKQYMTPKKQPTLANLLVGEDRKLRTRIPPRNELLLNDLFELKQREPITCETHLFGKVTIAHDDCRFCGLCAYFCPTGALTFTGEAPTPAPLGTKKPEPADAHHYFRTSDCVACGLCQDVCTTHALTMKGVLSSETLFELEPKQLT